MAGDTVEKDDVQQFWTDHPLGSFERSLKKDRDEFYSFMEEKRDKIGKSSRKLYELEQSKGVKILELGCGPGYNIKRYAQYGAKIAGCDITVKGPKLAANWLKNLDLEGFTCAGDVENAPFKSEYFDKVISVGVLHHTPGIANGLKEMYRTMKPGGKGLISVYYDCILLRGFMYNITRFILWMLRVKFHGNIPVTLSMSKDEFGRLYDGPGNVLGKIYSKKEITGLIKDAGFRITKTQLHFFPTIFIPGGNLLPYWLVNILDRTIGTLIYFQIEK